MRSLTIFFCATLYLIALVLSGCSTPSERSYRQAAKLGFVGDVVMARGFKHQIYRNRPSLALRKSVLHVYLAGDGRPWLRSTVIAEDPTSRAPLVLKLMAKDEQPSLYLGRPCYHGFYASPSCHPSLWTGARYSETVVASMTGVLAQIITAEQIAGVTIFGYSGGGTLAVLLAARIPETLAVVTVAGNLDIDAWAEYHGYTPLTGSINPVKSTALNPAIEQLHLVGEEDGNILKQFVTAFTSKQRNSRLLEVAEYDHGCCWPQVWPQVLAWSGAVESGKAPPSEGDDSVFVLPQ
ncbi:hypothetical protein A9Q89_03615 [Gammaproteobacteria bacterium 53_120_T64]|nr:hypothetical protein A9Q89_03615 [Gammaproteobacteria bacterium 53_120_T64]